MRWARIPEAARAAVVFALVVTVFLATPIIGLTDGQWYSSGDAVQRSTTVRVDPVFEAEDPLMTDPVLQMQPWRRYNRQQFEDGRLPAWNDLNGGGVPHLAAGQTAVFSPFSAPFYVLGFDLALVVSAFAILFALGYGTWLFLRRIGLGPPAALVGGLAFMFGGYNVLWLPWHHTASGVLLPVGLWLTEVALQAWDEERRHECRLAFAALAAAVALTVFAGHAETTAWAGIMVAAWASVRILGRADLRAIAARFAAFAGAVSAGAVLAAAQLLPMAEYVGVSSALEQRADEVAGTIPRQWWHLLVYPHLLGDPGHDDYQSLEWARYQELVAPHVGIVVLLLALLGAVCGLTRLLDQPTRWLARFAVVAAPIGITLAYSDRLAATLSRIPLLDVVYPNRSHIVWLMAAAILAACGVEAVGVARRQLGDRARWIAAGAVLVLGIAVVAWTRVAADEFAGPRALSFGIDSTLPDAAAHVARQLRWLSAAGLAVTLSAAAALAPWRSARLGRAAGRVFVALAAVTVFATTALVFRHANPTIDEDQAFPRPPQLEELIDVVGDDLAIRTGDSYLSPDANVWYGLRSIGSYDALGVWWYDELYASHFNTVPFNASALGVVHCHESLDLFGVRFVVEDPPDPEPAYGLIGAQPLPTEIRAGLDEVDTAGPLTILEVPDATPRYSVVTGVAVTDDWHGEGRELLGCAGPIDTRNTVLLATDGPGSVGDDVTRSAPSTFTPRAVEVVEQSPDRVRLRVEDGPEGWLVARDTWYPGWTATVDGESVPVHRGNVAFRAVEVPAGVVEVEFRYESRAVSFGMLISTVGWVAWCAFVANELRLRHRSRRDDLR